MLVVSENDGKEAVLLANRKGEELVSTVGFTGDSTLLELSVAFEEDMEMEELEELAGLAEVEDMVELVGLVKTIMDVLAIVVKLSVSDDTTVV